MKYDEKYFKIAEENGIKRTTVYSRLRNGWDIQRAITEKSKSRTGWEKWRKTAEENGVKQQLFYLRIKRGMTPKQAATTKIDEKRSKKKIERKALNISREESLKKLNIITDNHCNMCERYVDFDGTEDVNEICKGCDYKVKLEEIGETLMKLIKQERNKRRRKKK